MTAAASAIQGQSLTKIYGSGNAEVTGMEDVTFSLSIGEVVGLLGPSGSGKSTLLTIMGLINAPTSGKLLIGKVLVTDGPVAKVNLRAYRRKFIGYVLQKTNLIPFLTAVENVQLALEINDVSGRAARSRAIELLESLDVVHRSGNLPYMLSGGEQQRVAIARALANKPMLVLADEPTAALDSVRGRQVMELFRTVAREYGTTVMVATHDHRSLDIFDRILEMEDGKLRSQKQANKDSHIDQD
ncbi:MAG: ABC transporter ATP-binding protein [Deltaproteobacteria bacterium]|nr:ABC transporter ATP-binding protein [Deltaproteobacteria bacterium]